MNPFYGLPIEVLQAIAVYAWIGMIVAGVLGLWEVSKHRAPRVAKPLPTAAMRTVATWLRCPAGHCKVLGTHNHDCPQCGAQLVAVAERGILIESATGRFIGLV